MGLRLRLVWGLMKGILLLVVVSWMSPVLLA